MTNSTQYSLRAHNTFGIDAMAARFIEYHSVEELKEALDYIHLHCAQMPILHIGAGSNLLFSQHYPGVVLHSRIEGIELLEQDDTHTLLRVGAGVVWDDFVAYAVAHNLSGIENLSAIPGEVGASAIQNIGAYGVEAKDVIVRVETIEIATGEVRIFEQSECQYGYRTSLFKHQLKGQYIVTHVQFHLSTQFTPKLSYGNIAAQLERMGISSSPMLAKLREAIITIRNEKLPDTQHYGNAGSFFMNPVVSQSLFESLLNNYPTMPHYHLGDEGVKIPAGWLIEQCGWKGRAQGRAGVYEKQALVLVNLGGATADEVIALSDAICADVLQKFGITITPEVNFV